MPADTGSKSWDQRGKSNVPAFLPRTAALLFSNGDNGSPTNTFSVVRLGTRLA